MKRGEQAKLIRELKEEHNIKTSPTIISRMVQEKDYRIVLTPSKSLNFDSTIKALLDSGFGERSKKVNETIAAKKGKPVAEKKVIKEPGKAADTKEVASVDIQDYIDADGKISTKAPRAIIERFRLTQSAEKDRIKNEKDLKKLVDFNATSDAVFNFLRPFRDDILDIGKRISAIAYQAGSKQKAQKAIDDEVERIFKSRVGDDYKFDDELKKKITKILLMSLRRQ